MHVQDSRKVLLGVRSPVLVILVDTMKMPGIPRHEFKVAAPEQWIAAIKNEMASDGKETANPSQPTIVKEVIREIVKYPCPYCNVLIEVTSDRCPFCGAPQKK